LFEKILWVYNKYDKKRITTRSRKKSEKEKKGKRKNING